MVDVSVIGCGNMGGALVRGLVTAGYENITVYDVDPAALETVASFDVQTTTDPSDATDADLIFLVIKPALVGPVLEELDIGQEKTVVSIAAGVSTDVVANHTDAAVVRLMPNLAAEWGEMAGAVTGDTINDEVIAALDAIGEVVELDEQQMHTATAVNGSGPAFVFYLIKAMQDAGIAQGLAPSEARILAAQTFKGAAETVLQSDESIESLIDAVCSPKGTTIEGMAVLEDSDIAETITEAVVAAEQRAEELAEEVQ